MRFVLSLIVFLSALPSMAAIMSLQGGLGMANSIFHINVDVDYQKKKSHSFGGYLIYGQGKEDDNFANANRGSFWSLGGDLKVFFGPKSWKVYLAPGVGIISFESPGGGDSETTLGTLFKVGALTRIAPNMYLGLEQAYLQNWFSAKVFGGTYLLTSAAFRINF